MRCVGAAAALWATLAASATAASVDDCPGYTLSNLVQTLSTWTADLTLKGDACNVYGTDIKDLKLLVEYQTDTRLHVKIYDAEEQVYQIPKVTLSPPTGSDGSSGSNSSDLIFSYTEDPFSFAIVRKSTFETLFNTSGTDLIFESQYVRLRTSLPSDPFIYGLGEDSDSFLRETKDYTRTLWNIGTGYLPTHSNLYSSHPVYIEMRNGSAHGVFLFNSNGMDIKINQTEESGQYLEYNTIGGVLDFYFMAGPSPADVARQYAGVVGTPAQQAYWTYGFHQCKYGYQDVMMVAEVVYNYSQANIPLETMWTDIDYMDLRRTWTLDPERFPLHKMQELVGYLHDHQQKYILMVDPPISINDTKSYEKLVDSEAYLRHPNGSIFVGTMWPGAVSYLDWYHPNSEEFYIDQIGSFFAADKGVDVDGIWIDMNDPQNFCAYPCDDPVQSAIDSNTPPAPPALRTTWPPLPGFPDDFQPGSSGNQENAVLGRSVASARSISANSTGNMTGLPGRELNTPPYAIGNVLGPLYTGSIWPDLVGYGDYVSYDTHNLYASGMISHTRKGLLKRRPNERPFIITRSTFAGDGRKSGHWTGDNVSLWSQYLISIFQNMEFASIFQIPTVGADVCGFNGNTTELLCARWAMLGAWYPFYRNHAGDDTNFQEFYRWPLVADAARKAIHTRFALIDYFYSHFTQQTIDGSPTTVIPLFYEYPNDVATYNISYQFFFGPSILVSPVTVENSTSVDLYLPKDTFYDYWTGQKIDGTGATITLDNITYTDIPVHIRGGSIVPRRLHTDTVNTTTQLREQDFEFVVAPDADGKASGVLFLDDGISLDSKSSTLRISFDNGHLAVSGSFEYPVKVQVVSATVLGRGDDSSFGDTFSLNRTLNAAWETQLYGK